MKIALAGNPNSGKTTMFNALTGKNERVGNWAGVTVDKKEAAIKKIYAGQQNILAVDLPGAYSMSPFTAEESITRAYVQQEAPDAIINIVDATNLSRSLFFTTQLLELGIPMVVALNKTDINQKKKTNIDTKRLSQLLGQGCHVDPGLFLFVDVAFVQRHHHGDAQLQQLGGEKQAAAQIGGVHDVDQNIRMLLLNVGAGHLLF